jgi:hypothetical protein
MSAFGTESRLRKHQAKASAIVVVAFALSGLGQQTSDPMDALLQARERLLPDLARMPRYTCVQTITRKYFAAPSHQHDNDCGAIIAASESRKHELRLRGWDRLRLEIATVQAGDVFSWVGASRFDEKDIAAFAGRGPLGSGDFGALLDTALARGIIHFKREELAEGRRFLEYSYDIPLERSSYKVYTDQGLRLIPFQGDLVLDPEANDILRLTVRTGELPESSTACQAISEIEYGRTTIHDRPILIPHEVRLRTIHRNSSEALNSTIYTGCREYASRSRMLLQAPKGTAPSSASNTQLTPSNSLPAGLRFNARIVTSIDSDSAAAGDPIEGILRSPIRDKQNHVIVPAGARFHGRLMLLERQFEPADYFKVGVRLESVEAGGTEIPLAALTYPVRTRTWVDGNLFGLIVPPDDPSSGVATFLFRNEHLRLKQLDSEWITVARDAGAGSNDAH